MPLFSIQFAAIFQQALSRIAGCTLRQNDLRFQLRRTAKIVAEVTGASFCNVLELDRNAGFLILRAGVGWRPGWFDAPVVSMALPADLALSLERLITFDSLGAASCFSGTHRLYAHAIECGAVAVTHSDFVPFGRLGIFASFGTQGFSADTRVFLQADADVLGPAIPRFSKISEALSRLFDQIAGRVVIADSVGRVLDWNDAATAVLGYSHAEPLGRHVDRPMPGINAGCRTSAGRCQERWRGEVTICSRLERCLAIDAAITPLCDQAGLHAQIFAVAKREKMVGRTLLHDL